MSGHREPDRVEPVLGDLDKTQAPASPTRVERRAMPRDSKFATGLRLRQPEPRPRSPWPWIVAIVLLLAVVGALFLWRGPIGNRLVPVPRQTLLMRDAERALAQGNLTSPDGRGASELYAAVLALDPDQTSARQGLTRVGEAALGQARSALQRNDLAHARTALALAHRLAVPMAEIQPLDDALREHTAAGTSVAGLLDQAAVAERGDHLDDGDASALALLQRALAADAGNAVALARRQNLFARMLDRAATRGAAGDVDSAARTIEEVAAIDAGNPDLPVARAQLAAAREHREHSQAHVLESADSALHKGRIDAAVAGYRGVLAQEPDNTRARDGLRAAADAYAQQANRQSSEFAFAAAAASLAQARTLAPDAPSVRAADQHLRVARAHRGEAAAPRDAAADRRRVADLLADAERAIGNDELLDPPGDSAFDKLRVATAIAPNDPGVRALQRRFGPAAIDCFERAMVGNKLDRAEGCLDALLTMQPAYPKRSSMREALAQRWMAIAEERLGAGEFAAVRHALDAAHRLSPRLRGLPALEARLLQARGGH